VTWIVDKHRCQLGHYDRSALAGIYVYLQKCMIGSTVSAYGDIRPTNPHLHFPTYVLALTYGRPGWGLNPVLMVGGWWVDRSEWLSTCYLGSGGGIRTWSYASVDKHRCQLGHYDNVLPYAHPQLFKTFKHLIYVWHRCGIQFERFYSLSDSLVGTFSHLHHIWFQRTSSNLGIRLWW
jgi:hypothetical protein